MEIHATNELKKEKKNPGHDDVRFILEMDGQAECTAFYIYVKCSILCRCSMDRENLHSVYIVYPVKKRVVYWYAANTLW